MTRFIKTAVKNPNGNDEGYLLNANFIVCAWPQNYVSSEVGVMTGTRVHLVTGHDVECAIDFDVLCEFVEANK